MQPAFATAESLWPLDAPPQASQQSHTAPTERAADAADKNKARHRARRKPDAATDVAGSTAALSAEQAALAPPTARTASGMATQSGGNGGGTRGNNKSRKRGTGRGGTAGNDYRRGAGARASGATRGGYNGGGPNRSEVVGLPFSRTPFARGAARPNSGGAQSGDWRRDMHTDANAGADETTASTAPGQGRGGQAKAKKANDFDKGTALLEQVASAGDDGLNAEITRLYEIQRPSPAALAARQHLVDELTDWLNREHFRWGHPHNRSMYPLKIEPFGSVRFGLGTSTSDLDLCLLDPYRPNGFVDKYFSTQNSALQRLPDIYDMRRIGRSLQQANLTDVRWIPEAAVPICKFKVMIDGHMIEADLNTNERLGVFNSRLINSYCNLHPLVRPLSVFIKFWAKQRGLNDPSGTPTTFSSYTLILLVISYLQHLDLLPNLQDPELIASTGTAPNRFFSTPKARARRSRVNSIVRSIGWDVTFVEYESTPENYAAPEASLTELARGFFQYYGEDFDMERMAVSIWHGAPLERQRPFGTKKPPAPADVEMAEAQQANGDLTADELQRQRNEDADLSAFAAEVAPPATAAPDLDSLAADLDAMRQEDQAQQTRPQAAGPEPNSRSSSPIEYEEYEEPERWADNLLVVQDPFILTRNCPGNVAPDWVEELRVQMRRARDLIDQNASIKEICAAVKDDPDYLSVADKKKNKTPRSSQAKKRKPKPVRLRERAEQQQAHDEGQEQEPAQVPRDQAPDYVPERPGAVADPADLGDTRRREQEAFRLALADLVEKPAPNTSGASAELAMVEEAPIDPSQGR